jgi:hypothetical protein
MLNRRRTRLPLALFALCGLLLLTLPSAAAAQGGRQPLTARDLGKLHAMLKDGRHWKSRSKTAKVLGALGRRESVPHLVRCLREDPDHLVRGACAWALGALEHPAALAELHRVVGSGEPEFVLRQAEKALHHILSRFPGNLPPPGEGQYFISIDPLRDRATKDQELTKWVQQYFLEHLMLAEGVDVGDEMNIEADGEFPDVADGDGPVLRMTFLGGVEAIQVPPGRTPGEVAVDVRLEVRIDPLGKIVLASQTFTGKAPFAGGEKPKDAWTDDPLVEAEKVALKMAVDLAYAAIARQLKLVN